MEITNEQKILSQVINEAWNNPSFKQELMASPQEAVKKLTGETFSLPAGKTLEVCDNSKPGVVYLNIPESPNMENLELTDAQLEVVAGGCVPDDQVVICFPQDHWTAKTPPIKLPGLGNSTI